LDISRKKGLICRSGEAILWKYEKAVKWY